MKKVLPDQFWAYACEQYAKPNCEYVCLRLQDKFALNVNCLLLAEYLTLCNIWINKEEWSVLNAVVKANQLKLQQHRIVRRSQKGSSNYQTLLNQELALERDQQRKMVDWINQHDFTSNEQSNLFNYLHSADALSDVELTQLAKTFQQIVG